MDKTYYFDKMDTLVKDRQTFKNTNETQLHHYYANLTARSSLWKSLTAYLNVLTIDLVILYHNYLNFADHKYPCDQLYHSVGRLLTNFHSSRPTYSNHLPANQNTSYNLLCIYLCFAHFSRCNYGKTALQLINNSKEISQGKLLIEVSAGHTIVEMQRISWWCAC